jgi:predicted amidohydrolase YtcJ
MKGKKVDLIVHNARIHVMDDMNTIDQAMAIKDGKIVEVGPERQILNKYRADEEVDCKGKDVYPGFTDAHGHLFSYAKQKLGINLTGVKSWGTLLVLVEKHQESRNAKFVIGSGWDQSLWTSDVMPTNTDLNQLFPNIPVALYRVDGHAVLVNDFLLKKAGINQTTKVQGGQILLENGVCTGLLVDKAMDLVKSHLPDYKEVDYQKTILEIQEELFQYPSQ